LFFSSGTTSFIKFAETFFRNLSFPTPSTPEKKRGVVFTFPSLFPIPGRCPVLPFFPTTLRDPGFFFDLQQQAFGPFSKDLSAAEGY